MMDGIEFIDAVPKYPDCPVEHIKDYFTNLHWVEDVFFVTDKKEFWENEEKTKFMHIPIRPLIPLGIVETIMANIDKTIFDLPFYADMIPTDNGE